MRGQLWRVASRPGRLVMAGTLAVVHAMAGGPVRGGGPTDAAASASSSAGPPAPRLAGAVLGDRTLGKLEDALACVNLSVGELGWDKRPITDEYRLSCVNETLDYPLAVADRAVAAESQFASEPEVSIGAAALWLDTPIPPIVPLGRPRPERFSGAPRDAALILDRLLRAYEEASRGRDEAMRELSGEERKMLRASGARLYTEESEEEWDMTPVLSAAKKVDLAPLLRAASILAATSREAATMAASANTSRWPARRWVVDGVEISLGGAGAQLHSETIVLDPAGDDTYTAGAIIVDLSGDDTYRAGAAQGLLDVALVLDIAGNDRYLGKNFSQGGTAFGCSLLIDMAGDDRYEADQCSQGSAFFGVGLLFDMAGSDVYRGARFVQGFGGTRGLGALSDLSGNDTYYAGGKYSHAPLLPDNYQSLSQGFGFGLRGASASGGVGILADHAGNDVYSAEVFGQGASYWFSLGVLVDSAGHDKYDLYQYGQGAGIHLSAGVLFDRAGNDAYSCNNGVAQGSGHDWGVGLLWDRAGNDCYQGSGMSQGGANANAIGMLIDRAGNDSYAGWNEKNQGDSFFSRGTIGLGVLLDLAGKDKYTHGGKDDAVWTRGTVGVGQDSENPDEPSALGTPTATRSAPPRSESPMSSSQASHPSQHPLAASPSGSKSDSSSGLDLLWKDACLWEVGSNTEKVSVARKRLVAEGMRAVDYLIPAKLATKDTLVTRALNVVITGVGRDAVPSLTAALESPEADVRRNAADLLGALGATETAPAIAKLLSDPDARLGALAALGSLKSAAAAPEVAALMESDAPERVRYTAAATLGAIGGEEAAGALSKQLASPVAPLAYAAQFALEQIRAVDVLRGRLRDEGSRARLHAIAALGHIGDASARTDLLRLLDDPSPLARGFSVEAMASMMEPADRELLRTRLAGESDPFVKQKLAEALERTRGAP